MGLFKKIGRELGRAAGAVGLAPSRRERAERNNAMQSTAASIANVAQTMVAQQRDADIMMKKTEERLNSAHMVANRRLEASQARSMRGRSRAGQFGEAGDVMHPLGTRLG